VVLLLDEGSVDENPVNAHLPEMANQDPQVLHQFESP